MLKRNGEDCEHPVPNYPGLLTTTEFKAYRETLPTVTDDLKQFNERANTLAAIEKQSPEISGQVTAQTTATLSGDWQPRHVLFQSPRSEMRLCARDLNGKKQFGIIEKLPPNSPYARLHGESDLQMTGYDLLQLLQNFVEAERGVLHFFRQDIEAKAEECLAEKFPVHNNSRVIRAISAQCESQKPMEREQVQPAKSVRIKI
jgi:hypothetical protein